MGLAGLERHLQDTVTQPIPIQTGDGHGRFVVVRHGDEAEPLALVGVEVADHLDVVNGTERSKELPQDALVRVRRQVVDEDAPACSCVTRDIHPY